MRALLAAACLCLPAAGHAATYNFTLACEWQCSDDARITFTADGFRPWATFEPTSYRVEASGLVFTRDFSPNGHAIGQWGKTLDVIPKIDLGSEDLPNGNWFSLYRPFFGQRYLVVGNSSFTASYGETTPVPLPAAVLLPSAIAALFILRSCRSSSRRRAVAPEARQA